MSTRPIANKYREGKLKSTLKRESKDRETAQSISQWSLEGFRKPGITRGVPKDQSAVRQKEH